MYIDFGYMIDLLGAVASTMSALVFMVAVVFTMSQIREYRVYKRRMDTAAMLPAYLARLDNSRANIEVGDQNYERAIHRYLGEFEAVALLINADVWDYELSRSMISDHLRAAYDQYTGFVMNARIREKRPDLYENFERLAYRWGRT